MEISTNLRKVIEDFPTNTKRTLDKESYFWVVYSYLLSADRFLELGYRKGFFTEVCKAMGINSVHVDISDRLLKALPTKLNKCITISSIDYLKKCSGEFDVIFQDGSKRYKDRVKEYNLIMGRGILASENGIIIVDDLHYDDCKKAFDYAVEEYGFVPKLIKVKDKRYYNMGVLHANGY